MSKFSPFSTGKAGNIANIVHEAAQPDRSPKLSDVNCPVIPKIGHMNPIPSRIALKTTRFEYPMTIS